MVSAERAAALRNKCLNLAKTCRSGSGPASERTSQSRQLRSAFGHFSDMALVLGDVRFSNRPFEVKHFQTIHHCSVDVARGLVLLYGIGTRALPSWDSRTRRNNLLGGLAVRRTAGPSGLTNSPHPSSREGHLSTAGWNGHL